MGAFTIAVPEELADRDLTNFFRGWNWHTGLRDEVVVDLSKAEFIAPWALTLFSAYGLSLAEAHGNRVRFHVNPRSRGGSYAIRSGMLELFGSPRPAELGITDDVKTTQLSRIATSADIPAFADSVMRLLELHDEELEGAVKYSLIELLRNVVQHARSPIGGVSMAQYYPQTGLVELAVADYGVGIRQTLLSQYPTLNTDLHAIKLSLLPHVSGTFVNSAYSTMRDNAGLGLFFIKEIITRSCGGFFLGSGKYVANLWGDPAGQPQRKYVRALGTGWPGTFAVLQLRREKIVDFDSLLRVCRELAAEARRDITERSLDFLAEVPDIPDLCVIKIRSFAENVEEASRVRDSVIIPTMKRGELVVLDFEGIPFATQSFVHACLYKVLRDCFEAKYSLSISGCTGATEEAIRAVAAYAKTDGDK